MELRHLRYFVAVAEELNFTRAAERLFTSQPSLSEQVRNLEEEVGAALLRRTKRKVELTDAGRVFLDEARTVLRQAEQALTRARQAAQQAAQTIRIGFVPCAEVMVFPHVLPELRLMFPNLNIVLHSLATGAQEAALLGGDIDIAFMRPPLQSTQLLREVVLTEPVLVFLHAQHPLAAMRRIAPAQLNGEPYVIADSDFSPPLFRLTDEYLRQHQVARGHEHVVSNILLGVNLVSAGLGYALFPAYAQTFCTRSVCARPLQDDGPQMDLVMVTRPEAGTRTPVLDALMGLVRDMEKPRARTRTPAAARR